MDIVLIVMLVLAVAAFAALLIVHLRLQREDARIRQECTAAQTRAEGLDMQLRDEKKRVERAETTAKNARDSETEALQKSAKLQAELQAERDASAEKIRLLRESRAEMERDFENLAQKILEKKGATFNETARKEIGALVTPLTGELKEFRDRAEKIHHERTSENASLLENIANLQKDATRVAEDANNLTRALKGDKKALGDWGETTLERILEESGLQRGSEYEAQPAETGEDGKALRPDFKILLPEGRHLIVDSKASLVAYHDYVSAQTDAEREKALSDHVAAVRNHARTLAEKHYQRVRGMNSPDFVFMFMPIEAAWMAALLAADKLFDDSYDRKVILVARTTLLPTLKTVAQLWKFERQSENAQKVAELAGRMHAKFAALVEEMGKIDHALLQAREVHRRAMTKLEGRGNLLSQAKRLEEMGVGEKGKIPERILEGDGE